MSGIHQRQHQTTPSLTRGNCGCSISDKAHHPPLRRPHAVLLASDSSAHSSPVVSSSKKEAHQSSKLLRRRRPLHRHTCNIDSNPFLQTPFTPPPFLHTLSPCDLSCLLIERHQLLLYIQVCDAPQFLRVRGKEPTCKYIIAKTPIRASKLSSLTVRTVLRVPPCFSSDAVPIQPLSNTSSV